MNPSIKGITYVFCLILLFLSCSSNNRQIEASHYTVKLAIDIGEQLLNTQASIYYKPIDTELKDSIEFLGHEKIVIRKCEARGLIRYTEKNRGNKIKSIVLYFDHKLEKPLNIFFDYEFELTEEDAPWGIDKISESWIELSLNSSWLPIVSSFDNHFTAEADIILDSKSEFDIISSGETKRIKDNVFKVINKTPQIDLVLIGSSNFQEATKDNITVYESNVDVERTEFINSLSNSSFDWLQDKFGNVKKLPKAKLVITPRSESGYARKNLIVLSNNISVKDTIHFASYITHEFAHYWSVGINPLTEHRWLSESIAEYIAWKYVGDKLGKQHVKTFLKHAKNEADKIPPVYVKGNTEIPMHAVMYRKGVYKLFELEKHLGEENMYIFLLNWFKSDHKNSEDFLNLLEQLHGAEVSKDFRLKLSQ